MINRANVDVACARIYHALYSRKKNDEVNSVSFTVGPSTIRIEKCGLVNAVIYIPPTDYEPN